MGESGSGEFCEFDDNNDPFSIGVNGNFEQIKIYQERKKLNR